VLADLGSAQEAMKSLQDVSPSPALRERVVSGGRIAPRSRGWLLVPAAAALVLVVWGWSHRQPSHPGSSAAPELARVIEAETVYDQAIADLQQRVAAQSTEWPPELKAAFDQNLQVIDDAIAQTRTLAVKHSDDPETQRYLLAAYQEKVDLLTEATEWSFP
jgi:hypothetical protein